MQGSDEQPYSAEQRARLGKEIRARVPRSSHAAWDPPAGRADPIALLEAQASTRIPELVPIRHGRMLVSPFTYYRGAALPMASDLAATPHTGLRVQVCGDAHLSNFGFFGSPERHLSFDVNDFDETAPGPWEWDLKRLAASLEIAGRDNGFTDEERDQIVRETVRSYRETMREFAGMNALEVWYRHLDMDDLLEQFQGMVNPRRTPAVWRAITKARAHDSLQAFEKLCGAAEGEPRIRHDPPLVVPVDRLGGEVDPEVLVDSMRQILREYTKTLHPNQRHLLERYRIVHLARKVVGVGSVGTDAWIMLLLDAHDAPLLLQIKEAEASVLEQFTAPSGFTNHGQRVVGGQRLMQATSDIFLGWERFSREGRERDYYIRQLRDWKGSADIAGMTAEGMSLWGGMCSWSLAHGHARSGDPIAIGSYLGKSDVFDHAIAEFSVAYADQSERDFAALKAAVAEGRLEAELGI